MDISIDIRFYGRFYTNKKNNNLFNEISIYTFSIEEIVHLLVIKVLRIQ